MGYKKKKESKDKKYESKVLLNPVSFSLIPQSLLRDLKPGWAVEGLSKSTFDKLMGMVVTDNNFSTTM